MPIQVNVASPSAKKLFSKCADENAFFRLSLQVHQAYQRQGVFFNYLMSCHDLWEQADVLVAKGNHTGKLKTHETIPTEFSRFHLRRFFHRAGSRKRTNHPSQHPQQRGEICAGGNPEAASQRQHVDKAKISYFFLHREHAQSSLHQATTQLD